MVEKSSIRHFSAIEDGSTDWTTLRNNLDDLEEAINNNADEITALARHQTFAVSKMVQTSGKHVIMNASKHARCKIIDAFCTVHDNIALPVTVTLVGFSQPVRFSDSETKGSGKSIALFPNAFVHFAQNVEVSLSENRRVSVHVTFESIEEEEA